MTTTAESVAEQRRSDVHLSYLRPHKKFPNLWCPGCGNGIVMSSLVRAIDKLGLPRDEVALVSGIGCSSRMPVYLDFQALHTTHGRALAFATGVKFARPDLKVIVITGDGDALSIGGNHLIHACRRNIDITTILINNYIYGMTGGQVSPTTPSGAYATTTPFGNTEKHFEPCDLAKGAGATFVARTTVYHTPQMDRVLADAIAHHGFSFVEVLSNCHTYFGRLNRLGSATALLQMFKEKTTSVGKTEESANGKIPIGVLHRDLETTELCDEYQKIVDSLSKGKQG
ncbi:MAG TPA: 2-oxoacid:ferredoxin oxidoreductase subunit beta [Candidatus Hydrogenedentes bacterium]|nr:2-oxoacid:ferredoxin oxidoreductase subunit beta [Candidatus Hydrogenedentota bacterium]HNT87618.1 2-oxoacid:ferredoxin oxidoreductase subunit beta [Candidatus Hydrogenedentota bacterium]